MLINHMPKIIFVSALYKIYDYSRTDDIICRFKQLSAIVPIHLVCDPELYTDVCELPNVISIAKPFAELATYNIMCNTTNLPVHRSLTKDTTNFMILMNAKTEFMEIVRNAGYEGDVFIWLDAGLTKIFANPVETLLQFQEKCRNLSVSNIIIPGCWSSQQTDSIYLQKQINWRFCGGFFIVPSQYLSAFTKCIFDKCTELATVHNIAIWEVNVWAYIEHQLPIQWTKGDHNETIFSCLNHL
jgi:hypothetical protein